MLGALKLIVSFAQEDLTIEKYDEIAKRTLELSKKASVIYSIMHGFCFALVFGFFCYCYAVGGYLIYNEKTCYETDSHTDCSSSFGCHM